MTESRQALWAWLDQIRVSTAQVVAAEINQAEGIIALAESYTVDHANMVVEEVQEQRVEYGHDGTPLVSEYLLLELAPALGMSQKSAAHLLISVLNLHFRHPRLWTAFTLGKIRRYQADQLTELTHSLNKEAADLVDRKIALTVGKIAFPRLRKLVQGWVVEADPQAQAKREDDERSHREVYIGDHRDGSSGVWARLASADALALDHSLEQMAHQMAECGDQRTRQERRAAALGILADPVQGALWLTGEVLETKAVKRRAIVHLHLTDASLTNAAEGGCGVVRIEGIGPLSTASLPEFLRGSHVTIRPVIDHGAVPAVDAYEIPDKIREAVLDRTPFDIFPFSSLPARGLDLDHITPWRTDGDPGQTCVENLAPVNRRAHRAKTLGAWKLQYRGQQRYVWESPLGKRYETSPTGTVTLSNAP